MKALQRRGFDPRALGTLACLALLVYGAVSFSRPHHSYVLSFALTGPLEGSFEARIDLDDGFILAPVVAWHENNAIRTVALPTRTIRGIALNVANGQGARIIRDVRVIKAAAPVNRLSTLDLDAVGSVYRTIDLDAVVATEGLRVSERAKDHLAFQILPGAARSALGFDLRGPMPLLRDMQITWLTRLGVIVLIGAAALWLLSRGLIRFPVRSGSRLARLLEGRGATATACALWAIVTFAVYFVYAGRLVIFGWNITEFIIADHLADYGRYALGATYPTAIWRPVGPTFLVVAVDALARDPLLTYQLLSAAAVTSLTVSTYLLNRVVFGQLLAHTGAALAFATPAVTLSLLNHTHSISHLCFLLVASPTLLASALGILVVRDGGPRASQWLWLAATGWSFCYLCRPESMFMAAAFFVVIAVLVVQRRRSLRLLIPFTAFVVVFAAFNVWASVSAARDDLLARNPIYQLCQPRLDRPIRSCRSRANQRYRIARLWPCRSVVRHTGGKLRELAQRDRKKSDGVCRQAHTQRCAIGWSARERTIPVVRPAVASARIAFCLRPS